MRENRPSGSMSGMWKRSMAKLVRHRQTKEPANRWPRLHHRAAPDSTMKVPEVIDGTAILRRRCSSQRDVGCVRRGDVSGRVRSERSGTVRAAAFPRRGPAQGWKKIMFRAGDGSRYPGEAPSASATCRKAGRNGNDAGRCTTTRRTETSTRAPSFSNRSRSVQT